MDINPEILDGHSVAVHLRNIARELSIDVVRAMSSVSEADAVKVHLADIHILGQMLRKIYAVDTSEFCTIVGERFPVMEAMCKKRRLPRIIG